ncbi:MAG: hypothetical protein HIU87_13575 [Acidobacteria bacterium]|nr:hypothetical protein [Acidobacteriota bacterium]
MHSLTAPTPAKTLEWNTRLQIAYRSVNGTTYFEHKNWLGTERLRTDYTGATAATYQSLSFGDGYTPNILQSAADQDNNHFATLDHDSETATEHAQFRQYASAQGLWMSPDPYMGSYDLNNPQSFNRYSYVMNRPLSFTDVSGLDYGFDCGDSCVGVVGTIGSGYGPPPGWDCLDIEQCAGSYPVMPPVNGGNTNALPIIISTTHGGAPNNCPGCNKPNQTPRQCADQIANTWSLTQAVPNSVMNVPVLGGFLSGLLGNTVTNITGLFSGTMGNTYGTFLGAGPTLGIPVPSSAPVGLQGPTGVLISAFATGAGKFVGASKAILDVGIYAEAYNYCKTGKY